MSTNKPGHTELVAATPKALSTVRHQDPVAQMLAAVIEKGVTPDNVAALEKLCGLYERMQEKDAERQFADAFVRVQTELPKIDAVKGVPDKTGNIKYYYAPLEEIMPKVLPVLHRNGFSLTFNSEIKDDRVIASCTITHIGGHHKTNVSMAKIGGGPPGASAAQADGSAATYAKRRALCDAFSIVADVDNDGAGGGQDARNLGTPISRDKAQYLREQVAETGSNEEIFLQVAQAKTYEEIGEAKYHMLVRMLEKKKAEKR